MSFRLSKEEAELRAVELAQSRLASLSVNGWQCEISGAIPDPLSPSHGGRKVPRKWVVSVLWSKDGALFDGPGVIVVDVETGVTQLVEIP